MGDHLHMSDMDVFVRFDEVSPEDRGEEFGWGDFVLLGHDICSILHGVRCDYNAVVCFSVATAGLVLGSMDQGLG